MKTMIMMAFLVFLAGVAFADLQPDSLGLYGDVAGTETEIVTAASFQEVTLYLLLQTPLDSSGVSSWECSVTLYGPVTAPSWELSSGIGTEDHSSGLFHVVVGEGVVALPYAETILLATWTGFVAQTTDTPSLTVASLPGSTVIDGQPYYTSGADASVVHPLVLVDTCWGAPAIHINQLCGVPAEYATWSEVKDLYR